MAFICGDVPLDGPEREWLNSFNFMYDGKAARYEIWYNDEIVYRRCWSIDRDRKMFILCVGGGSGAFDVDARPLELYFVWNKIACKLEVRYEGGGSLIIGRTLKWRIDSIVIPREYKEDKEAIVDAIKEAMYSFDKAGKRETIVKMAVELTCEPVFIG